MPPCVTALSEGSSLVVARLPNSYFTLLVHQMPGMPGMPGENVEASTSRKIEENLWKTALGRSKPRIYKDGKNRIIHT